MSWSKCHTCDAGIYFCLHKSLQSRRRSDVKLYQTDMHFFNTRQKQVPFDGLFTLGNKRPAHQRIRGLIWTEMALRVNPPFSPQCINSCDNTVTVRT